MESFIESSQAYPCFSRRVWQFVEGLLALPEVEFEPRLYDELKSLLGLDQLALSSELYEMTVDELKAALDKELCPTWEDLGTVGGVGNAMGEEVGTYILLITAKDKRESDPKRLYCGTASSLIRGISGRTAQHRSAEYRAGLKKKGNRPLLYNLLDDPNCPRDADARKAGVFKLKSGDMEDVLHMRIVCHLQETMLDAFLQSWYRDRGRDRLLDLGPWQGQSMAWSGVNSASPLKENFTRPEKTAELDPVRRAGLNMARYHDAHDEGRKDANALKVLETGLARLPKVSLSLPKTNPQFAVEKAAADAWRSRLIREPKQRAFKAKRSAEEVRAIEQEGFQMFAARPWLNPAGGDFVRPPPQRAGAGRKRTNDLTLPDSSKKPKGS